MAGQKRKRERDNRTAHQRGNRNTIVEDIRQTMARQFRGRDISAACLYWTKAACLRLGEAGQRAILQAGSASWVRVPPELDDGVVATHYSYMWEPQSPANVMQLMKGEMPEMHVWAALPERNQIVDLTTGFQPERCEEMLGMDWPAAKPPDWLWMEASEVPATGAFYEPCPVACSLAMQLLSISPWGD